MSSYMRELSYLSQPMIDEMFEPVWQFDGETGYALGWGTRRKENLTIIEHGGGFPGVSAYVCMIPSDRIGVAVVSNHDGTPTQKIGNQMLDLLLQDS